jgi:hypothetical protein
VGSGFWKKARALLSQPTETFQTVRNEAARPVLHYFWTLLGLFSTLSTLAHISGIKLLIELESLPDVAGFVLLIVLFIVLRFLLGLLVVGIIAGCVHLAITHLGAERPYRETLKIIIYAMTPFMLLGWLPIPYIALPLLVWTIWLALLGIGEVQHLPQKKAFIAVGLSVCVLSVAIGLIYWFCIRPLLEMGPITI